MGGVPDGVAQVIAEVAAATAAECGMPADLLDGYLAALSVVADTGRRLSEEEETSVAAWAAKRRPRESGCPRSSTCT